MDWYDTVFELIDMRSFSNLWYWIALAVTWSSASHWVLGVPWDMAVRARKSRSEEALTDFEDMVRINTNRILYVMRQSGLFMVAIIGFLMTMLALLGFVYGNEFAQAVFLLGFPLLLVGALSVRAARRIAAQQPRGAALIKQFQTQRFVIQLIGMLSIFVTAMWGMYQNMNANVLG
ncbi:component of SufBCD complex [uncultured Roseovarius sp.]|uniref:component of SufBCD complex n=1 Tax=uncultured Roseovarius sp. TaxID=293344 RepID=UPI00262AB6FB|nr:component of SufBCD complex [uncultured Roseovarius sp.]